MGFLTVTQNIDIEISRGKSLLAENTYILTLVNGRENRNSHALIIIMVWAYMRLKPVSIVTHFPQQQHTNSRYPKD